MYISDISIIDVLLITCP